tara:strand:+ start:351 stop:533 length:183 start_codon:yes stop_codon:yes gene_type:complete
LRKLERFFTSLQTASASASLADKEAKYARAKVEKQKADAKKKATEESYDEESARKSPKSS